MKEIYVCYASSDEYAGFTGISLYSLLENNRDFPIKKIFILDYGIKNSNKQKLFSVVNKYDLSVEYIESEKILENFKDDLGIQKFSGSFATYSRAFIDYIMPDYVRYLLYIDSDTVVTGKIDVVSEIDMERSVMAGVIGVNQYPYKNEKPNPELNLLSGNKKYIACGIVFYDLKNWRDYNCNEMIIQCCKQNIAMPLADQTLINNAIPEKLFKELPPEMNYWGHCYPKKREYHEYKRGGWYSDQVIENMINAPIVIHYKGLFYRPWFDGCHSRKKNEYIKYKAMTPWADLPQGNLREEINKAPKNERIHLRIQSMISKVPYDWMAQLIQRTKSWVTRIMKFALRGKANG